MPNFVFTARDGSGTLSTGQMAADSISAAVEALRADGKYPTSLVPAEEAAPRKEWLTFMRPRLSRKDVLQFATQIQVMVETGVTLSEALESIATQSAKPAVREIVGDVYDRVQKGETFSSALSRHPRSFPRMMVTLVAASEKSGLLAKLLGRTVNYLRDENDTLRRVRGALTYPAIMLAFTIATTCGLMTFVLPRFTAIYKSKGATLPIVTRILMAISDVMVHDWYWLILGLGIIGGGAWQYGRTPSGRRMFQYAQLQVPLFGKIFQKLFLSRGLRLIGTMANSGISLPDSVRNAQTLTGNIYFQDLWERVGKQIESGKQFSAPLFESPLVPKSVAQMLHSAEKGGRLAQVMEQVSGFAEEELKAQIVDMTRYIEPCMVVIMGAVVGTVALGLMLPIFTISKVIVK
ncbi:MAG: type II secretion system F family protein [Tepidisphaeraceae bacterium]|jgi:type IV pilus assembly protein PilC